MQGDVTSKATIQNIIIQVNTANKFVLTIYSHITQGT